MCERDVKSERAPTVPVMSLWNVPLDSYRSEDVPILFPSVTVGSLVSVVATKRCLIDLRWYQITYYANGTQSVRPCTPPTLPASVQNRA